MFLNLNHYFNTLMWLCKNQTMCLIDLLKTEPDQYPFKQILERQTLVSDPDKEVIPATRYWKKREWRITSVDSKGKGSAKKNK